MRVKPVGGRPEPPSTPVSAAGTSLDNGRVKIVVDPVTGDIRSLQATAAPGVDFASAPLGLHAYRYVPGFAAAAAVGPGPAHVVVEEPGPLVATLRVESDAPGARRLVRRVTLVAADDRVWLETLVDKVKVREKESAHVAFPFNLPGALVRVDEGEAQVTFGKDQLPGSCFDFIGPHSAIDVSGEKAGIGLATLDAPLLEVGAHHRRAPDGRTTACVARQAGARERGLRLPPEQLLAHELQGGPGGRAAFPLRAAAARRVRLGGIATAGRRR